VPKLLAEEHKMKRQASAFDLSDTLLWCFMTMHADTLPPQCKISWWHLAGNNSIIPPIAQNKRQEIFICFCIWKLSLVAGGSMTIRSKKPLTRGFHRRRHHSTMQGYKTWYLNNGGNYVEK
jgi:hypothetical protein